MDTSTLNLFIFWLGTAAFIPLGIFLCTLKKSFIKFYFILLFLSLPFPHLSITFFPWEYYKAATRGIEIHLADLCGFVIFFTLLIRQKEFKIQWLPPLSWPFFLFLFAAIISWLNAESAIVNTLFSKQALLKRETGFSYPVFNTGLYPVFEIIKIIRGYFIFWISYNYFGLTQRNIYSLIKIIPAFILFYLCYNLFERYGLGIHRVTGGMEHPNLFNTWIAMLGALIIPFAFAEDSLRKKLWYWLGIFATIVIIILTISRSSLAAYAGVLMIGTVWGIYKYFKINNLVFTCFIFLGFFLVLAKSFDTLSERFFYREATSLTLKGRGNLNEEAALMASDHPLGVGLGNFSAYSTVHYAELTKSEIGAMAHNIWYLTLGELGYFGVLSFAMIWFTFLWYLAKAYMRSQRSTFAQIFLMGVFLTTIILLFQNLYHFTYRLTPVLFLTQMILGATIRIYSDSRKKERTTENLVPVLE